MATNKKIGNSFEAEFCEILFQHNFWCHNMAQNQAGQDDIAEIHQKDVNNYCERQTNGKEKAKGGYLVKGISTVGAFKINNNDGRRLPM